MNKTLDKVVDFVEEVMDGVKRGDENYIIDMIGDVSDGMILMVDHRRRIRVTISEESYTIFQYDLETGGVTSSCAFPVKCFSFDQLQRLVKIMYICDELNDNNREAIDKIFGNDFELN